MHDDTQDDEAESALPDGPASAPGTLSVQAVQLLRTVQVNTMALSQMADQKASILMGATFLVFSISVSRSLTGEMPWSLAVLAVFAFLSSLLAVMAVIPNAGKPARHVRPNLMFFGHFADLDEAEWVEQALAEFRDDESVYRVMLHDIYQNGQVLQRRKYRYLRYAYRTFIYGLFVTLAAFGVELALRY